MIQPAQHPRHQHPQFTQSREMNYAKYASKAPSEPDLKHVKALLEVFCSEEARRTLGPDLRFTARLLVGEELWHRPSLYGRCVSYLRAIGELPLRRVGTTSNGTILYSFLPIQPITRKEVPHGHCQA